LNSCHLLKPFQFVLQRWEGKIDGSSKYITHSLHQDDPMSFVVSAKLILMDVRVHVSGLTRLVHVNIDKGSGIYTGVLYSLYSRLIDSVIHNVHYRFVDNRDLMDHGLLSGEKKLRCLVSRSFGGLWKESLNFM